ncbi:hypothetical protein WN943_018112 [Citrus x changshan-huyou]
MKVTRGKGAVKKDKNEVVKPVEDRAAGKRKAVLKASRSSNKRTKNVKSAKKDPNKPKRPPSAFFVFLEEFRKVYKQEHPNVKAVSAVGKAGGEKWKSLTDAFSGLEKFMLVAYILPPSVVLQEKAPFEAKAAKRKLDYEKLMTAYNKKQESTEDEDEEESEKSKSEVHDDDDDEELEEEDEEEDDD